MKIGAKAPISYLETHMDTINGTQNHNGHGLGENHIRGH